MAWRRSRSSPAQEVRLRHHVSPLSLEDGGEWTEKLLQKRRVHHDPCQTAKRPRYLKPTSRQRVDTKRCARNQRTCDAEAPRAYPTYQPVDRSNLHRGRRRRLRWQHPLHRLRPAELLHPSWRFRTAASSGTKSSRPQGLQRANGTPGFHRPAWRSIFPPQSFWSTPCHGGFAL